MLKGPLTQALTQYRNESLMKRISSSVACEVIDTVSVTYMFQYPADNDILWHRVSNAVASLGLFDTVSQLFE